MLVQLVPLADTWIWKAVAYAASHCNTTWQTVCAEPRSTCTHCGSLKALDQRVPVLPSKAALAGVPAFSVEDAVAGWPWATFVAPQPGAGVLVFVGVFVGPAGVAVLTVPGLHLKVTTAPAGKV